MNWSVLYYGDGVLFPGDDTIFSLTTSYLSLTIGVWKWTLFKVRDGQESTSSSLVKLSLTYILIPFKSVSNVLFYSSVLSLLFFDGLIFIPLALRLLYTFVLIKMNTEADKLTAVAESILSIITKSPSFSYDLNTAVLMNRWDTCMSIAYATLLCLTLAMRYEIIDPLPELFNNSTLAAMQDPEVIDKLMNSTNNLQQCRNICSGVPDACREYYQIQTRPSSADIVSMVFLFMSPCIFTLYIICYWIKIINTNRWCYPEERIIKLFKNRVQLQKKIPYLVDNAEYEYDQITFVWYIELELQIQSFLESPTSLQPNKERFIEFLNAVVKQRIKLYGLVNNSDLFKEK